MSTPEPLPRRLSECVKCKKCREARQKCVWSDSSPRCDRCVRFKHPCSPGVTSDRAQRGQSRAQRNRRQRPPHSSPNEQAILDNTQHASLSVFRFSPSDQDISNLYSEGLNSSQMSRATSSDCSTRLSTPNTQQLLDLQPVSDIVVGHNTPRGFSGISRNRISEWFQTCYEYDANFDGDAMDGGDIDNAQRLSECLYTPEKPNVDLIPLRTPVQVNKTLTLPTHMLPGLINLQPSRKRMSTPKEERLEIRIIRLWDSEEAFASASSGRSIVTPLFGRTFSELFRWSRQLAEDNEMVREARYACGAADACMNTKLPAAVRAEFLRAYNRHDFKARTKLWQAVHEFAEKIREGESPDVMPLYIATFLHHAAGACIRGSIDVDAATAAFDYYNRFTKAFPIRLMRSPTSDGQWAVDMLLANNDRDPGMRISSLMFALGQVRLAFDRKEGLC